MRTSTKIMTIAGALLMMAFAAGCGHPATSPSTSGKISNASTSSATPRLDPLTGQPSPVHGPLIALMIENSEYARPQYGLSSADVVYEAYTENFYYSRFMLLYWGHAPHKAGPVRSARPYFVSWVHEWPAAYAHAGGSTLGDIAIQRDHIHELNALTYAQQLYWRSSSRIAPHNLFTNVGNLMQAANRRWGNPSVTPHWKFVRKNTVGTPPYKTISLRWNSRNTEETWQWNSQDQGFTRWVQCPVCSNPNATQVMGLNSGKPVVANNVVIQYTTEWLDMADPNAADRWILMNTHGQGKALLFLGHRYYQGTWQSAGPGQPTQFFLANGQQARFNRGKTWIEVVPTWFHVGLTP